MQTNTSRLHQEIQLSDGRILGYSEIGDPLGFPILFFHGGNGSRLEARWFESSAIQHRVRLITPDRPGFGLSDFQQKRTFLDWSDDIQELITALKIETFSVFGLSGGAPHVLAVCLQLADSIHHASIISGVAPPTMPNRYQGMWLPIRFLFFASRYLPFAKNFFLAQMGNFYSDREMMEKRMLQALPQPDKDLIANRPEILDIYAVDAKESHRQGIEGDAWEWHLYAHDWQMDITQIQIPIALWYGRYDQNAPLAMGQYYANTLNHSHLHVVEDGGHFSTINNHIDTILKDLKINR